MLAQDEKDMPRPVMGRPPMDPNLRTKPIGVAMPDSMIAELDAAVEALKTLNILIDGKEPTRSLLVSHFIEKGLDAIDRS